MLHFETLTQNASKNLIFVGHGGAFANGLSALFAEGPRFGPKYLMHNAAITELVLKPAPELLRLNDYAHLPKSSRTSPGDPTMPNKPNFPIAISDISADWLESRLSDGFPGAKVQDFR